MVRYAGVQSNDGTDDEPEESEDEPEESEDELMDFDEEAPDGSDEEEYEADDESVGTMSLGLTGHSGGVKTN